MISRRTKYGMPPSACILAMTIPIVLASTGIRAAQTRVYAGNCIFQESHSAVEAADGGLVSTVVGSIVKNTFGRIGKALRAAGEEDADVIVGRDATEFEAGSPPACIIVAKGDWRPAQNNEAWKLPSATDASLTIGSISLMRDPDFVLELLVESSEDRSALRLVPSFFEYRRMIEDEMPRRGKSVVRGIGVEVVAHAPGVGIKDKEAIGTSLVLGNMETGYRYRFNTNERQALNGPNTNSWEFAADFAPLETTTAWFPTFVPLRIGQKNEASPTASDAAGSGTSPAASASNSGPGPSTSATTSEAAPLLVRTITATFTETREPRNFLLFLADVFDESQEQIQSAAELAILESRQQEAEIAAAKASNDLMTDYVGKLAAAEIAIIKYCSSDTPAELLAAAGEAQVAQRNANLAALLASQPTPYTILVEISDDTSDKPESLCS